MAFVYESNVEQQQTVTDPIALGVRLSNSETIFKTLYSITDQARENLKCLLLTKIGERYMLPEYGTDLLGLVFQPSDNEFNGLVQETIRNPIAYWLPYIIVETLDVKTAVDDALLVHAVNISLEYSIDKLNFSTNTIKIFIADNLVSVE